jgi:hypothetical protein
VSQWGSDEAEEIGEHLNVKIASDQYLTPPPPGRITDCKFLAEIRKKNCL